MSERLTDAELTRIDGNLAMSRHTEHRFRESLRSMITELREHRRREAAVQKLLTAIRETKTGVPGDIWDAYLEVVK